ncbi:urease accessory protein UreH [Bacillus sp. SA1-12]|uniref:HoxN/HupN/NixA family nickel/cobalt transporter n=1 Tax=Bacillus sp. SA1-12 TaxID=1455638 RepID=UPI000626CB36|nr:sulfite exporter TauE/SafE family protein [Bacillus sp. SA1-12]KKI94152.1 urease accessory protein UreH [Bacillus sp. SA1-12]
MAVSFLSVLFLGFILGIKHSIEPDHVIAVATIASKTKRLWRSTLAGVFWGIGHTITLFIVGMVFIFMKDGLSEIWTMSLEFLVGIMLVYLGVTSMLVYKQYSNQNEQDSKELEKAPFLKSMCVGSIHGIAGSAALVLLTMSTVSSIWEGAVYILVFGAGTIVGMLCFTTIIGIPFVICTRKNICLNRLLTRTAGAVSFVFGIYYMYNLGVTEGLFKLWVQ